MCVPRARACAMHVRAITEVLFILLYATFDGCIYLRKSAYCTNAPITIVRFALRCVVPIWCGDNCMGVPVYKRECMY